MQEEMSRIPKSSIDQRRQAIFSRLKKTTPHIVCPSGKVIDKMCTNEQCSTPLRCSNVKCNPCHQENHQCCISTSFQQVTVLLNKKIQKWTEVIADILMKEEEFIERIRDGQDEFVAKFYGMKLRQNGLEAINLIYEDKNYHALCGRDTNQLIRNMQKKVKVDEREVKEKGEKYLEELMSHVKELERIREKSYLPQYIKQGGSKDESSKVLDETTARRQAGKYLNEGIGLTQAGRYQQAIKSYKKSLDIKPNIAQTHYNLGLALKKANKPEQALVCYKKATQLKSDYLYAYYNMGILYFNQNKFQDAVKCYKKAISINANDADTYVNLGVTLKNMGKIEEAIKSYQKAIETDVHVNNAYENLQLLLLEKGRSVDKLKDSIRFLQRIIVKEPNHQRAKQTIRQLQLELSKIQK